MRRILFWILLASGLLTIITGIAESQTWHEGPAVAHIVISVIFILTIIIHLIFNHKVVTKYIKGK